MPRAKGDRVPRPHRVPHFLVKSRSFLRYTTEVSFGRVKLPAYEEDSIGAVIVHPGEIYCRVPGCSKKTKALSSTPAVRTHVRGCHGIRVSMMNPGSLTKEQKETSKAFFSSIYRPRARAIAATAAQA